MQVMGLGDYLLLLSVLPTYVRTTALYLVQLANTDRRHFL